MIVVYIVTTVFVMVLLLSIPLFPFWKVWGRMKTHHPEIWQSAGPFEPNDMIARIENVASGIQFGLPPGNRTSTRPNLFCGAALAAAAASV